MKQKHELSRNKAEQLYLEWEGHKEHHKMDCKAKDCPIERFFQKIKNDFGFD